MIWKSLSPNHGGTYLRWKTIHKFLLHQKLRSIVQPDIDVSPIPLTLFDFTHKNDLIDVMNVSTASNQNWRISDDGVIGGYSSHRVNVINRNQERYIRWTGTINTTIGKKSRARRSGFCALQSPSFPFNGLNIGREYNALEIVCRGDERVYVVNLKVASYFPDDLYQGCICLNTTDTTPHDGNETNKKRSSVNGDFVTLVLPLRDFVLTSGGLVREQQRDLDGYTHIQHIGFTQMDGQNGEFLFDLKRVRAVQYFE